MKSIIHIIFLLLLLIFNQSTAQSIGCDRFCVQNIYLDTIPGYLRLTIFFAGDNNDFINYPHVSLVTDLNGDTLGTGTLDFFGQIGNTSQDYTVTTDLDSLPDDLAAIVTFHYDTSTCTLYYPCIADAVKNVSPSKNIKLIPNPMTDEAVVQMDSDLSGTNIQLFNATGQCVRNEGEINGTALTIHREGLAPGMYLIVFQNKNKIYTEKLIIAPKN